MHGRSGGREMIQRKSSTKEGCADKGWTEPGLSGPGAQGDKEAAKETPHST